MYSCPSVQSPTKSTEGFLTGRDVPRLPIEYEPALGKYFLSDASKSCEIHLEIDVEGEFIT